MQEKIKKYEEIGLQLTHMWDNQIETEGNLANYCALIQMQFSFWWVGFYKVKGEELHLSVFQGPSACTRIGFGKGVCGTAWKEKQSQVVKDVHTFPGHIACSSASQSEIVIPLILPNGNVWGVLDIDSEHLGMFDETDRIELEKHCKQLVSLITNESK